MSDAFSLFLKAILSNGLVGETFQCLSYTIIQNLPRNMKF